jgi:peptidoglycan/LPS O-acetylase OafA/YrhL
MPQLSSNTFLSLEGLRFVSSLAIVAFHYVYYLPGHLDRWTLKFGIAVDLFFVISGIVIGTNYIGRVQGLDQYGDFVRRRIARLYPLHLATLAFYVCVGLALSYGLLKVTNASRYDFSDLLPNLLLVHAWGFSSLISFNYVSWSISAELFLYLIFPLVALAVARGLVVGLASVALSFGIAVFFSHLVYGVPFTQLGAGTMAIIRACPSFALGVWLCLHCNQLFAQISSRWLVAVFHGSFVVLAVCAIYQVDDYILLMLAYLVVATALACDVRNIPTLASWSVLSSMGCLTYSTYMLHLVMATIFMRVLVPKLLGESPTAMVAGVAMAIGATLFAAMLSYRFFEEPLRQSINGIRLRRKTLREKC